MDINKILDDIKDDLSGADDQKTSINELLKMDLKDLDVQLRLYDSFKSDIERLLHEYLLTCKDINAGAGMYKCSFETWQAFSNYIGLHYFLKNKYLFNKDFKARCGGTVPGAYDDTLLSLGVNLYEDFCQEYKKQFLIYDCCRFLGINKDTMYALSASRPDVLKKCHVAQEGSMRAALVSGRSNVTAMAILLNHDYDYTRTTQVIHTSSDKQLTAADLPQISGPPVGDDL